MLENVVLVNHKNRPAVRSFIRTLSTGAWTTIPLSIEDARSRRTDAASKNETSKDFLALVLHSYDLFVDFQGSRPLKLLFDSAVNRIVALSPTDVRPDLSICTVHVKGISTVMWMLAKIT